MANIKKSFNFRNGIQVDEDNLLVTSTGLVGIGTTVPKEALDIVGNVIVSGVTSSVLTQIGVLTVTTVNPTEIIGAGVSIQSGIITNPSMDNTGIVTYYGDGRYLQGLPTSQWEDTNAGFGVSSIYNTGGTVGIATTNPQFTLQVGDNANLGQKGVGISSYGDVRASGIITATGFVGNITGDVTGNISSNLTVAGVSTFNDNIFAGIGVTVGIGSTVFFGGNAEARFGGSASSPDLRIYSDATNSRIRSTEPVMFTAAGIITISGSTNNTIQSDNNRLISMSGVEILETDSTTAYLKHSGNTKLQTTTQGINLTGSLNVSESTTLGDSGSDTLTVSGPSTFQSIIEAPAGMNKVPSLYASQSDLPSAGSYHGMFAHVHSTGAAYFAHAGNWIELVNKETDGTVGTGTETYSINSLSIGTNSPANDVHLRKSGDTELQITSDTGTAAISVGRESGTSNTNNAEIRYGEDLGTDYSNGQSLDILNYGTGNFNYHLSANDHNAVNGDFHWHRGVNNVRLMTLTGIGGSLGIGLTIPQAQLHVQGDANISGDVITGGDLNITGNLNSDVIGNVTGTLIGNVNSTSGVSTFFRVDFDENNFTNFGEIQATRVGIGTTCDGKRLRINTADENQFSVSDSGLVGIKTDEPNGNALLVSGDTVVLEAFAVGKNQAGSAVDFSVAGQNLTGVKANRMYMVPPKVGAAQTSALVGLVSGAMIYNTNLNKLQVYNGTNWETITSVEVTG